MADDSPDKKGAIMPIPDCMIPEKAKVHLRKVAKCLAEAQKEGVFGVCYLALYDEDGEGLTSAGTCSDMAPDSAIVVDLWRTVLIKELQFAIQHFDPVRLQAELAVAMNAAKESLK